MSNINDRLVRAIRTFNLRTRFLITFIIILFVFTISILGISRYFTQVYIEYFLNEHLEPIFNEIVSSVELVIDEANILGLELKTNSSIYELLENKELSYEERSLMLRSTLEKSFIHNSAVNNISIVVDNSVYTYRDDDFIFNPEAEFLRLIDKTAYLVCGPVKKDKKGEAYIPIGLKYKNFHTGQEIGYLILYIRESYLRDLYKDSIKDWGYFFIITNDDLVISHPDQKKLGTTLFESKILSNLLKKFDYKFTTFDEEPAIVAAHEFDKRIEDIGIEWRLVSVINEKRLNGVLDKVNVYILLIDVVLLIVALFVSFYISSRISKPLANLKKAIKKLGPSNFSNIELGNSDEVADLEESFNDMVVRINELILKNNQEKEKQRELELSALQAQINPHFLYNTLDTIGWIARIKKQDEIEKLVIALAKFFRLSLHKGDNYITVEEEVQLVDSFTTIELMRSPDKFVIEYDIEDEIKSYMVLKIILQPLVENAIKHGVGQKRELGHILVKGYKDENHLIYEVIDDGIGFDKNCIIANNEYKKSKTSGYGLKNVDERIKLEYGNEYGLKIFSEVGKGTRIEVSLAVREE